LSRLKTLQQIGQRPSPAKDYHASSEHRAEIRRSITGGKAMKQVNLMKEDSDGDELEERSDLEDDDNETPPFEPIMQG